MPSGPHRIDLDAIHGELDSLFRPVAKTRPQKMRRSDQNTEAHARFVKACDALVKEGWSQRAIAKHLDCAWTTFDDVYKGNRYVPAWMLDVLPLSAQEVIERVRLAQLKKKAG